MIFQAMKNLQRPKHTYKLKIQSYLLQQHTRITRMTRTRITAAKIPIIRIKLFDEGSFFDEDSFSSLGPTVVVPKNAKNVIKLMSTKLLTLSGREKCIVLVGTAPQIDLSYAEFHALSNSS